MTLRKEIELFRSNATIIAIFTFSLCIGPIIYMISLGALPSKNSGLDNLFEGVKVLLYILFCFLYSVPIIYLIRNRKGEGNRIIIKSDSIIFPNNMWPAIPFRTKEVEIPYSSIVALDIEDQTERFNFKELCIITNKKNFKLKDRFIKEDEFEYLWNTLREKTGK